jgi:hypothetical protein
MLRAYWYDAARDGIPTLEHLQVGELRDVKLRLGRLSGGQQKGVDSLIVRDLMTLARERAVATGYLLAGDEDLREGVVAAQDMGMRVAVIGISGGDVNQAATLVREADELLTLDKAFLAPHFKLGKLPTAVAAPPEDVALEQASQEFAQTWHAKATPDEVRDLLGQFPVIPRPLDAELLASVELSTKSSLRGNDPAHRTVRSAFWTRLKELQAVSGESAPEGTSDS